MPTDPSITPNEAPSGGLGSRQKPAGGSNGAQAVPGADRAAEGRSGDSGFGRARLARFVIAPLTPDAPSTPPAARLSAEERPEAAGEPESGEDGTAGPQAAPSRRALTMREIRFELGHRPDWVGCNAECRMTGKHSLRWGGCEHAVPPEPTVSVNRAFTAADGRRSIGFDRYTVAELAVLIEPALREVGIRLGPNALTLLQDGHEVRLPAAEITRLALAAADAIVTHSNRDAS